MRFRTVVSAGQEVLFVGHEAGNSKPVEAWLATGRWKISTSKLDTYLSEKLDGQSFGNSIKLFVFCFEIADFEQWGATFQTTADYVSYRPKKAEIWSVGQIRWSDIKDASAADQVQALRAAIQTAIKRTGARKRKPKDFAYLEFGSAVSELLEAVPTEVFLAKPASGRHALGG